MHALIKKNCGLKLDELDKVELEAMKDYPVLNWKYSLNSKGEYCAPIKNDVPCDSEAVEKYKIMQYGELFDRINNQ